METLNSTAGQWRDIVGYEGAYQVSSEGEIRSVRFNRLLKPQLGKLGYYHVSLSVGGKAKTVHIHKLVAHAFLSVPEGMVNPTVDHISYVKADNRLANLRWLSNADNSGRTSADNRIRRPRGEEKPNAKLTDALAAEIREAYAAGGTSTYKLAQAYGMSHTGIQSVVTCRTWKPIVPDYQKQESIY